MLLADGSAAAQRSQPEHETARRSEAGSKPNARVRKDGEELVSEPAGHHSALHRAGLRLGVPCRGYRGIPHVCRETARHLFSCRIPLRRVGCLAYLVAFRAGQLFAPSDFKSEETYLKLQEMTLSAVASLTVAKQTKNHDRTIAATIDIDDVVRSVRSAANFIREGAPSPTILWVDDNPSNNVYERSAFESFGIKIVLSENTSQALKILSEREFDAIISDMGRREGQREGYVLLDALRAKGDETPLFFYASSSAPEHRRETAAHGGQGCTNDGEELFVMVTRAVFANQPSDVATWTRRTAARRL